MNAAGQHFLHVFPGFDPGGTQMRAVQLMGMLGAGVRHSVVAMDGRWGALQRVLDGVSVGCLPGPPGQSFWRNGKWFAELIRTQAPDLLLTYNWGAIEALLVARRCGFAAVVHHEDGFGPEEAEAQFRRRIWVRRLILRRAARVAVPSQLLAESARRDWWVPEGRLCYLPNGVDLDRFRPAQPRASRVLRIGSVGHLRPEKDQATLLRAFAVLLRTHPACELHLVGEGPERAGLEDLAAREGIAEQLRFHGLVEDPAALYRQLDLFVLSSRTEQMPLTVLEAMASGLPVVSTAVGDVARMLPPGQGGNLVPVADPAALAAALNRLCADPVLRATQAQANRSHCAAQYDKERCYRSWVEMYQMVAGSVGSQSQEDPRSP